MHKFTVTGSYAFPFDMLRYDTCWPESSEDAINLSYSSKLPRSVTLISAAPPTPARWASFGWPLSVQAPTLRMALIICRTANDQANVDIRAALPVVKADLDQRNPDSVLYASRVRHYEHAREVLDRRNS